MRLIDADALEKAIIELDLDNTSHWTVIHKINNAPTLGAEQICEEAGMTKEELLKELKNCRNELCLKCGKYYEAHKGACDDCRYNFEHMKKWEGEEK